MFSYKFIYPFFFSLTLKKMESRWPGLIWKWREKNWNLSWRMTESIDNSADYHIFFVHICCHERTKCINNPNLDLVSFLPQYYGAEKRVSCHIVMLSSRRKHSCYLYENVAKYVSPPHKSQIISIRILKLSNSFR